MPNVTATVILHTQRKLKDGTYPIRLRLTHQRHRDYISLNLYATEEEWGSINGSKPRDSDKSKKLLVNAFQKRADDILYDLERQGVAFSFERFEKLFTSSDGGITIFKLFNTVITELQDENRIGTAFSYRDSLKALIRFRNNKDLSFGELDSKLLKRFEQFILKDLSPTTAGIYLRSLRVICNRAIREGVLKQENYPFRDYTIPNAATAKRALKKLDVQRLYNYEALAGTPEWKAKNYWILSYLLQGMNFTDISYLRNCNIVDGRIVYQRTKTKRTAKQSKIISIKITPQIQAIIDSLGSGSKGANDFIFPILLPSLSPVNQKATIRQFIKITNKYLDRIGHDLGLPIELTTYVARHTYATVLKRNGAPTSVISESLGHHNERTTQVYLDSFENEVLDQQNANLL